MRKKTYTVDLTKIEGEGDFHCPKCGTRISPDDESEEVYTVVDSIIGDDDVVESLTIKCKKCRSVITLEGLAAFPEEGPSRVEASEPLPESKLGYSTSHALSLDGKPFGLLTVEYAQEEDVEVFKKLRNLRVGGAFKCTVSVESAEEAAPKKEDLSEIAKAVKRKFKGLRDADIYFVEMKEGKKNFIGRASNL